MRLVAKVDRDFFRLFSSLIKYTDINFEKIEIKFSEKDRMKISENNLSIEFDSNNYFIKNHDKDGMKILILKKLFASEYNLPDFIFQIISNRKIINRGFSKELTYYYYIILTMKKRKINDLNDFLEINIPWISFQKIDNYNNLFFKKFLENFSYDKKFESVTTELFSQVSKNMTSVSLKKSLEEYERIIQ